MVERLKFLMTGLSLSVDNHMVVKNRYLEYFNKHAVLDYKLSTCNDVYKELDGRVNDALSYIFWENRDVIRLQNIELSQKKEWWKIIAKRKDMEVFSRATPKDEELLCEYIYRMFIPETMVMPRWFFLLIWNLIAPHDEQLVEYVLRIYDEIVR